MTTDIAEVATYSVDDASQVGVMSAARAGTLKDQASLRNLRVGLGKTQLEIAELLETNQGEVSRIERRPDHMVSTMYRYAQALGGRCEIAFVFRSGRRVRVVAP